MVSFHFREAAQKAKGKFELDERRLLPGPQLRYIPFMITTDNFSIPAEVLADLEEAGRYAAAGFRETAIAKKAAQRIYRLREETRNLQGELNIAVELIREGRDE